MIGVNEFALLFLWALVFYDERGLLLGALRSPPVAGGLTGWLVGEPVLGLWLGLLLLLARPIPIRSGGHRPLSSGIAAGFGTGIAAVAVPTRVANAEFSVDAATILLGLTVGLLVASVHQHLEAHHRRRLDRRESDLFREGAETTLGQVRRAWSAAQRETAALAFGLGALGMVLRWLVARLTTDVPAGSTVLPGFGDDGGSPAFLLAAAALLGVAVLWRQTPKPAWVFVSLGLGCALLLR